ncbi:MAG: hypothetical protein SGJ23_07375 [Alphaproteobacteria bacterium]|nr:hypothetical protein [Alphaproteobacteria bacterium]
MDAGTRKTLKSLARTRTRAEMKALFNTIRAENDAALFAAVAPPKKPSVKKTDFAGAIAARLSVIHGPASDKADALIGVLEDTHGAIDIASGGLAPVIRKLAKRFGEQEITRAADLLMQRLEAMGSMREKVK